MQEKARDNLEVLQGLHLKDLIDLQEWQKIQDNFAAITQISVRTLDITGKLVTIPSAEPRLCAEVLEETGLKDVVCLKCLPTFLGGKEIVDKNLGFVCSLGLHNFVTPLKLDEGQIVAYTVVGPLILVERKDKEEYRKPAEQFNVDLEKLWGALLEIKVITFNAAHSIVELIQDVGEYTLKLAYRNAIREKESIMTTLTPKLERLLKTLLEVALEISKADSGSVMFLDEKKDELSIQAARGIDDEIVGKTRVKMGSGISGIAAQEGRAFLIDNQTRDNRIASYLNRPQIQSSMVIPLRIGDRVMGVMNLGASKSAVRFDTESIELMTKLIDLATVAIPT